MINWDFIMGLAFGHGAFKCAAYVLGAARAWFVERRSRYAWKSHDLDAIDLSDNVLWDREWDKVLDEQPAVRHGMAARTALGNHQRGRG